MADDMELFLACGLDETKAKDTLKNPKLTAVMKAVLLEADLTSCSSTIGKMLYIVATKFPPNAIVHRPTVVKYIKEEKIKTDPMVLGALEHLKKLGAEALDVTAFEEASGVGQEVTAEQILAAVAGVMEKNNAQLLEQRYRVNVGLLLAEVRLQYPWGDLKLAKVAAPSSNLARSASVRFSRKAQLRSLPAPAGLHTLFRGSPPPRQLLAVLRGKLIAQICERAFLKLAKARYLSIRLRSTQAELDKRIEALLGPKTEADLAKPAKKKGPKEEKVKKPAAEAAAEAEAPPEKELKLPTPGSEGHRVAKSKPGVAEAESFSVNSKEKLEAHLKVTGGKVVTRFPPEPNGYPHIGHAKAMMFDFDVANKSASGGVTIMRFDDTNPAAEKQEYIDSILDNLHWLGYKPWKVTYSSDYFQELYDLALELIKRGKAYACQQTKPETKASRDALQAWNFEISKKGLDKKDVELPAECQSPYRNRSVEENLRIFKEMKMGMWPEGSVCLRMKGDLKSGNSSMWDLAAYRIIFAAHPHSKDKWCIYPTYDYTHCLVDSLENVTHSLCTLEFSTRQAPDGPYYWLLDALDMYKPITWEFARCNITYNVMSKRKLNKLVTLGFVNGWDDPRILTLEGMRRRGYTATAINRFSEDLGVTKNDNTQHLSKLEGCLRNELEETTTRAFAVLDPLAVYITNYPKEGLPVISDVPNHPQYPDRGVRALNLTKMIYIERSDFREADSKDYFGLAPGKTVRLLFGYNMTCEHVSKGASGKVLSLRCSLDLDSHKPAPGMKMPKGVLHWASEESFPAEVRVYNPLFTVPEPGRPDKAAVSASTAAGGNAGAGDNEDEEEESEVDYLTQLNPNSLELYPDARIEPLMKEFMDKPLSKSFQFQRLGYFTVDKDSTASKPVLNRIVALKESRDVKAIKQR
ncbi:hypothetical protein CYMTET_45224 [Cymbomonas tetramitiformis]|uniref:glutamine--tRNA ligase n=1 Tax=Cymbomonas tetramitiformis TaxID=36881 RepID=A0AAE0BZU3_9CHLO|nr:hypothetical protein CYMTET_45224 [Cymbomonas tetramitiformis]